MRAVLGKLEECIRGECGTIGAETIVEARGRALKKDLALKGGDVLKKGTAVELRFLPHGDPDNHRIVELVVDVVGASGRNYATQPAKIRITALPDLVNGISEPLMSTMQKWVSDGVAKTVTGARVEPDGTGPDDAPSWLAVLGYI